MYVLERYAVEDLLNSIGTPTRYERKSDSIRFISKSRATTAIRRNGRAHHDSI